MFIITSLMMILLIVRAAPVVRTAVTRIVRLPARDRVITILVTVVTFTSHVMMESIAVPSTILVTSLVIALVNTTSFIAMGIVASVFTIAQDQGSSSR
ncbi:uncharacterized protein B0P05DRAFT_544466 [Gilbertella persicaria]|uniref:uncharacterized protein n=1 Tax=Gilbertella persicaria TaxID=101096 RepID=UPI00221E61C0|nr:uncharacterized protein B0P05DRAFT_544466 [Gilbertella persicaria]KAI8077301.1 hypothetical protein B0P05DRAFT_544466 [Gilbertella persicaria]